MADNRKYIQAQKFKLASTVGATDTTLVLQTFDTPDGTDIGSSDMGTLNYMTLEPATSREEIVSFVGTNVTQNADGTATITSVTRGLKFVADYSQDTSLRQAHNAGSVAILTNNPQFYDNFVNKNNDETVNGTHTYAAIPGVSSDSVTPVASTDVATKKYVDDNVVGGTITHDSRVVAGTAGATVAAGEIVYFDITDKEWKLADASAAATAENVKLGVAQGAGTDGNAIAGGVLLQGIDTNQTGMTAGTKQYLSDTAGGISESAGTKEVSLGFSNSGSTTDLVFEPHYDQRITEDEQDALAGGGDLGTPSATNKYTTEEYASQGIAPMTAGATINGATLPVPVYQKDSDNEFYACDANDTAAMKFLGFAISNGTDGASMDVQFTGIVPGFSALTEGEKYYVSDTAGTIANSPGTNEVLVGVAISETELMIQKGSRFKNGTFAMGVDTTNVDITVGFRVSRLKVTATAASNNGVSMAIGSYDASGTSAVMFQYNEATASESAATFVLHDPDDGGDMTFTITNITDTGFRITYTENGTWPSSTGFVLWEATGEL